MARKPVGQSKDKEDEGDGANRETAAGGRRGLATHRRYYNGMMLNLLQVEYPAPMVTIAESTTDEWADDQCNGQGAGQDSVHLAIAGYGYNLKEKGGRKGHGARATDALEGPENYAGVREVSVRMKVPFKASTQDWHGSEHLQLIDGLGRSAPGREGHEEHQ